MFSDRVCLKGHWTIFSYFYIRFNSTEHTWNVWSKLKNLWKTVHRTHKKKKKKNHSLGKSTLVGLLYNNYNFLDKLLLPYKSYGRDMMRIYFFTFASCELLKRPYWSCFFFFFFLEKHNSFVGHNGQWLQPEIPNKAEFINLVSIGVDSQ